MAKRPSTAEEILDLVEMGYLPGVSSIKGLPTLCVGQADDLKAQGDGVRVWLSRCDIADGEPYPNKITIERLSEGAWYVAETYRGSRRKR